MSESENIGAFFSRYCTCPPDTDRVHYKVCPVVQRRFYPTVAEEREYQELAQKYRLKDSTP